METLHKSNSTVFYFPSWYVHICQPSLPSAYWRVRKNWNASIIFPFPPVASLSMYSAWFSRELTQRCDRDAWSFMFLRTPLSPSCIWSKLWLEWLSEASGGTVSIPAYSEGCYKKMPQIRQLINNKNLFLFFKTVFKKDFYLFILDRGEEREKERERNISMCGCLSHTPY